MNFSLFIAQRLQLKGTKRDTSSSSTIIAVTGVAIAIVVMVITLTVVSGFKKQIQEKVMGFNAQITINPAIDYSTGITDQSITLDKTLYDIIEPVINPDSSNAIISIGVTQPGMLKTDKNFVGAIFKGINNNHDNSFIEQNIISGAIPDYNNDSCKNKIIISTLTANALNLEIGDKINTYFFTHGNIKPRKFEIASIYNSGFGEYDKVTAYASTTTLQRLSLLDSLSGNSIDISGLNNEEIITKSKLLQSAINQAVYTQKLNKLYNIDNVMHTGAIYLNWLDLLDTNVVVILILMSCVAGFTLVSCLFILILERVKTIGLLKSIGATNSQIRNIFIYMAQRLVLRGMAIGNLLSISFVIIQNRFHIIPLDPEAYYLSYVPIDINWWHIAILNIVVIIVSILILILPSHLVSTISPSQTMRYE